MSKEIEDLKIRVAKLETILLKFCGCVDDALVTEAPEEQEAPKRKKKAKKKAVKKEQPELEQLDEAIEETQGRFKNTAEMKDAVMKLHQEGKVSMDKIQHALTHFEDVTKVVDVPDELANHFYDLLEAE